MGTNRVTARNGLSYYDANRHCLVEVSGEVTAYKEEAKRRWPDLIDVWFDKDRLKHVVTVRDGVGNESLLFESEGFGPREISRIQEAENISPEQLIKDIHEANERRHKEIDDEFSNKIGDAGERLLHALKKDGVLDHPDILGVKNKRPRRVVNR